MNDISAILKKVRSKKKLSQKKLGDILGVSNQLVSRIESGKIKVSEQLLKKIMKEFPTEFMKESKKIDIKELEKEILETYDIFKMEKNKYLKIATINRTLIDLNKELEEKMMILETLIHVDESLEIKNRIKNPIKATIKNLEKNIQRFKNLVDETNIIVLEEE